VARALDVVGERWALLIIRELLLGPKRFTDLREGMPHLGPDILSQRLRELEQARVVRRRKLPPPAGSWIYELTDWGRELEPIVMQLGLWSSRSTAPMGNGQLGVDSTILALRTHFDPSAAGEHRASYELRFGEHHFRAEVADRRIVFARGDADQPDATIETDSETLLSLL
jgi:DNA-binding HxlR family transcriptional regulator